MQLRIPRATGIFAAILALTYLVVSTQFLAPLHAWVTSSAHHEDGEVWACALHKCGCKNALECKIKCCCFPKKTLHGGHPGEDAGSDGLAHWNKCGGATGNDQGLSLHLSPHVPPETALERLPAPDLGNLRVTVHLPASPDPQPPLKVPI